MSDWTNVEHFLARAVLRLADKGGMPDSFWQTDADVQFAKEILRLEDDERYTKSYLWEDESQYE